MVQPLTAQLIQEKNKTNTNSVWLITLQIDFDESTMRIVNNNEDITWNSDVWTAFPFELDSVSDATREEIPQVECRVCNINQAVQYYVELAHGGIGTKVTIRFLNSSHLDVIDNIPTFEFEVVGCKCDAEWAYFTLGASSPYGKKDPENKILKNFCRFRFPNSRDPRCPYTGSSYTTCNKTLSDCQERNGQNSKHYGGFPGVGSYAIYV